MLQIRHQTQRLPDGIDALAQAAAAENVRNVARLVEAWETGEQRFDRDGAALFAAFDSAVLAGIGGVKREEAEGESAMRMHRFYVHPSYRRLGLGKQIALAVMTHALGHASLLTCNARASDTAAPFWLSLGFVPAQNSGYTHIFRTGTECGA